MRSTRTGILWLVEGDFLKVLGTHRLFFEPLPDRDSIDDLSTPFPMCIGLDCAPQASAGAQMIHQLLFQHSTCLNEET
jgi:hypothetical protein